MSATVTPPIEPPKPQPPAPARRRTARWWFEIGLRVFGFILVLGLVALIVAPIFKPLDTYGVHDWDVMQAHRFLPVKTIKKFHQFPFWNPYNCGGHTWWAGVESGCNLVSPWLPAYLLLPFPIALRVEVAGAAALGAIGTWLLAGRFTKSPGARLLAAAIFLDGRWALQAGAGHAWHLYYAWTPWALFFLDRAIAAREPVTRSVWREVILLAVVMAMMVYTGAIYPLPQTAIVLALYAATYAVFVKSWRPIGLLAGAGALSFAFAAPRLLPLIDMLRRFPRLTDSNEAMDVTGMIAVFTNRSDDLHPALGQWGWHEFGIYVGWAPFLGILGAMVFARRAWERGLAFAGGFCLLLGLGRFAQYAPWALLHDHLPIFEAQHVPSRWQYPGAIVLGVGMVAIVERWLANVRRRTWLEVAFLFFGAYLALDIGLEAQKPMVGAFVRHMPPVADSTGPFHMEETAPPNLRYDVGDWAATSMPLMWGNIGATDCATFPGLHSYYRERSGRTTGMGARGVGDPEYRGEAFLASGVGKADITWWTPNAVTVEYHGARAGDTLVLNENWDPGWRANGRTAIDHASALGAFVPDSDGAITFRYVPRFFALGCFMTVTTIVALILLATGKRREPQS